jgi:hypothetical protein
MGHKNAECWEQWEHLLVPKACSFTRPADVKWRAGCTVKAIHEQKKGFPPGWWVWATPACRRLVELGLKVGNSSRELVPEAAAMSLHIFQRFSIAQFDVCADYPFNRFWHGKNSLQKNITRPRRLPQRGPSLSFMQTKRKAI